jgi:hypothetical protein
VGVDCSIHAAATVSGVSRSIEVGQVLGRSRHFGLRSGLSSVRSFSKSAGGHVSWFPMAI